MDVQFRTPKLKKHFEDNRAATKAYGKQVARKYIERVNIIKQTHDFEELKLLPGLNCHSLRGNRKGQWAVKLTDSYRLIFTLKGEQMEIIHIEEVSKHYGD